VADEALLDLLRFQSEECRRAGSALYGTLCDAAAEDLAAGGPCAAVLSEWDRDADVVPALRLLGGVHRLVLDDRAPDLAASFPSVGGDAERDPVPAFLAAVDEHAEELRRRMHEPVQTNEVGRSLALVGAFHEVARATGLPLRILEFGTSAGLNLRWHHFWYEPGDGSSWGDAAAPVRFDGGFVDGPPPFVPDLRVAETRGVDAEPVDPTSEDGRLRLLSFVWPDQTERFERLSGAIEVARRVPVPVDRGDGIPWIAEQVAEPVPGVATVVFHSMVLFYLSRDQRTVLRDTIEAAGVRAGDDSPLAWVGMEMAGDRPEIRLRLWPGGERRVVAECLPHGPPVRWLG
jgi:hypothetical protein